MGVKRVLFVDDEEALLRLFQKMLERAGGYTVEVESHAKMAVQKALDFRPQIIFIDVNMPDMEGSVLAAEIKAVPALDRIPLVFLTGAISAEEVESAGGVVGGQFFLAKPVGLQQLVNCIERHLGPKDA